MSAILFSSSSNPGLSHLSVTTFHNCGKADCTGSGQSKNRLKNLDFGPYLNPLLSEPFQGQKLTFWPVFLKHKVHLIFPMIIQKKSEKC